jgi:signal transduction histidine kinase/ActR/RegA family two-component response regulator
MMQQAFLDLKPAGERTTSRLEILFLNVLVACAYAATGYAGLKLAFVGQAVTLFWPPSGIAFAAIWLAGFRLLPGLALGAFVVNLVALGAPQPAIVVAIGNMLPATVATIVLCDMLARHPQAGEFWRVFRFILVAALGTPMLSATVGTLVLGVMDRPDEVTGSAWIVWWLGDAMGVLIVAPPILLWNRWRRTAFSWTRLLDMLGFAAAGVAIIAGLAFVREPIWAVELCKLFTLLLSLWAGVRFGVAGPASITILMSAGAVAVTMLGVGPFARASFFDSFALVHSYLFVTSITGILLAAALTDLRRTARAERAARAEAEAASANRIRLLSMISHDVRTPLAGIMGVFQTLDRAPLTADQTRLVDLGLRAGGTLTTLITDILDVARADAGRIRLEPAPFDPAQSIADIIALARDGAADKGLALTTAGLDELPIVIGDRARFEQVLGNLVTNAIAYTDSGHVRVTAAWDAGAAAPLLIDVSDSGPGMDPARVGTMFDAFALAPAAGNRSAGLGLGLHICARLTTLMGGSTRYEPAPGGGSLFRVALPLPQAPMLLADRPAAGAGGGSAQRLLLVEDDLVTREVTAALLESHGHQVSVATDGDSALAAAETGQFDTILLDLQLAGFGGADSASGLALARRIRTLGGAAGAARLVALTADGLDMRRAECRAAGLDGLIIKPLSLAAGLDVALAAAALALADDKPAPPAAPFSGASVPAAAPFETPSSTA